MCGISHAGPARRTGGGASFAGITPAAYANDKASLCDPDNIPLQDVLDAELGDLQAAFWPIVERIVATPATTMEGIQAKARASRTVWLSVRLDPGTKGSAHERLIFSLLADTAGRA